MMLRNIVITLLLISTVVFAQPPTPQPAPAPAPAPVDVDAEAKRHFDQGVALLQTGNNAAALAELQESYRLRPVAVVLKNIAAAQQGLYLYTDAIASLQRYLAEATNLPPQEVADVNQLIGEMKSLLADITVTVKPAGATITVDGRLAGKSPLPLPLGLPAGARVFEVSADGYKPERREISVVAGVAQEVKIDLVAIVKTAHVRIKATADGAAVFIDGKAAGLAPVELELNAGGYVLEVSATGHKTYRSELVIAPGQDREIVAPLEKLKHWYKNWKVLTVAGATLGVVLIGLAINYGTTEGPLKGTLPPGTGTVE